MTDTLLQKLEELNSAHFDEGRAIMKAFGGTFYPFDLLAYAVLNRSISLTSGFIMLMRADNFVAATTLVRPQLDNFLRFATGGLLPILTSSRRRFCAEHPSRSNELKKATG